MLIVVGNMTPDCDLYGDKLDDTAQHDDSVLANNCKGRSSAVFFYSMAVGGAAVASIMAIRFNFPLDGASLSYKNGAVSEEKIDSFSGVERHSVTRILSRDTPVASSLFRFQSYFYQEDNEQDDVILGGESSSAGDLDKRLLA